MAKKQQIATNDMDTPVRSENDLAVKPMHTAETVDAQELGLIPVNFMDAGESVDPSGGAPLNLLSLALRNAATNVERSTTMSESSPHSNPDPRKNSIVSNVHTSNAQMRIQSEMAICREKLDVIDAKIAELQAERTDLTGEYAMYNAALQAGDKL